MGNSKNLHVLNLTIILKLRQFDTRKIYVLQLMSYLCAQK